MDSELRAIIAQEVRQANLERDRRQAQLEAKLTAQEKYQENFDLTLTEIRSFRAQHPEIDDARFEAIGAFEKKRMEEFGYQIPKWQSAHYELMAREAETEQKRADEARQKAKTSSTATNAQPAKLPPEVQADGEGSEAIVQELRDVLENRFDYR